MKINLGILVYFTDTKLNLLLCWLELFSKPINNESLGKVWISKKNHQHRTQSEPQPNTISIHNYLFVTMGYFSEAVISESCVLFVSLAPTFCVYYFIKVFCLFNEWVQSPQSLVWFFCTVSKIFVISEENWQLYLCRCWSLLVFFYSKSLRVFVSSLYVGYMTCVFSNEIHCLNRMVLLVAQAWGSKSWCVSNFKSDFKIPDFVCQYLILYMYLCTKLFYWMTQNNTYNLRDR